MILKLLHSNDLNLLKSNVNANLNEYNSTFPSNNWILDFFEKNGSKSPFFDSGIEIEDIKLIMSNDPIHDFENARIIHKALHGKLKLAQAWDERLWAALTHTIFFDYVKARWGKGKNPLSASTITDRWFKGPLLRNAIARLYLLADITYDENLTDPYEYTKYLMSKQENISQVEGSDLCKNRDILRALLKASATSKSKVTDTVFRLAMQTLNQKGGITVLDTLDHDSLFKICSDAISKANNEPRPQNGNILTVVNLKTGVQSNFSIKNGKPFANGTLYQSKPSNLGRLTVGKKFSVKNADYEILNIE